MPTTPPRPVRVIPAPGAGHGEQHGSVLETLDFGNEAGDDVSPEELVGYFVEQRAFQQFLDSRKRILVATARKGVGKSALLKWTAYRVQQNDPDALVISVRGADLARNNFALQSAPTNANEYTHDWMARICAVVNRHLARELNLALSDDKITLVETAELEGYKSRNLVGALVDRMTSLVVSKDRATIKIPARNEIELLKRAKDRDVWIVIDDLDATFQNTSAESLGLATFFAACRYLTQDMKGVFFRVSMRTDVWALIRRYDEALDKTTQYVSEILWGSEDFLELLALRIKANALHRGTPLPRKGRGESPRSYKERLLGTAFVPKMQWGDSRQPSDMQPTLTAPRMVKTYRVIYTLSYERPRWAIQLCKLAREAALRKHARRIGKENIDEVWGEYGAKRIEDLVAEHKHQCPQVNELLNAFRGAVRLMTRSELFTWIKNRVSEHLEVTIEGARTRTARDIARFLYRIGFIVARSENPDGQYEHYRFDQMPDFLLSRTDDDFSVKWEIHPCYRQALDIRKLNQSHRERFVRQRRGER
jgi:hypothetical protein